MIFYLLIFIFVVISTVWSVKKQFNKFKLFVFINLILSVIICFFARISIFSYLITMMPMLNMMVIPVLLITRFISSRFIYKNLTKTKQSISRLSSTNPQDIESELISFIDKIKEGEFPKASISKSSISGDYVIVRDLNGVVLSQIKISEIGRY